MVQRRHFTGLMLAAPFVAAGCEATPAERPSGDPKGFSYLPGIVTRDRRVVPDFDLPDPKTRETSAIHHWIRKAHAHAALTMSICTGAFQFAKTGLLDDIPMTTNQKA